MKSPFAFSMVTLWMALGANSVCAQRKYPDVDYSAVTKIVIVGYGLKGEPPFVDLGTVTDSKQIESFVEEVKNARPQLAKLFYYDGQFPVSFYDKDGKALLILDHFNTSDPSDAFNPMDEGKPILGYKALICPKLGAWASELIKEKYKD